MSCLGRICEDDEEIIGSFLGILFENLPLRVWETDLLASDCAHAKRALKLKQLRRYLNIIEISSGCRLPPKRTSLLDAVTHCKSLWL